MDYINKLIAICNSTDGEAIALFKTYEELDRVMMRLREEQRVIEARINAQMEVMHAHEGRMARRYDELFPATETP